MRWTGALLLGVAGVVAAAAGCVGLPVVEPEVRGVEARIDGLDLEGLDVVFDVRVYNPLLNALHAPRFRYAVDVQGRTLASGRQAAGAEFPAAGVGTLSIPVRVAYRDLAAIYGDIGGRSEADYRLTGEIKVPLLGSTVDLPFELDGSVPIVRPPAVELEGVDLSAVSPLGGDVHVDVGVTNPNAFPVGVDGLAYSLLVRGDEVARLSADSDGPIAPGTRRMMRLTARFSAAAAVSGQWTVRPSGAVTTPYGPLELR